MHRFSWTTFDVRSLLPQFWDAHILEVARTHARLKEITPTSVTSRERDSSLRLPTLTVGGAAVQEHLPWLFDAYHGWIREHAEHVAGESIACASDVRYGCVINVQRGRSMRYECHVDSNPIEALLYVTTHSNGDGGELLVANDPSAATVEEVDADASEVRPIAGHLVFFDARHRAHYVRSMEGERVVVAMNYYTESCSEAHRPIDLNRHLFGED